MRRAERPWIVTYIQSFNLFDLLVLSSYSVSFVIGFIRGSPPPRDRFDPLLVLLAANLHPLGRSSPRTGSSSAGWLHDRLRPRVPDATIAGTRHQGYTQPLF
jgi:hypothetical protein